MQKNIIKITDRTLKVYLNEVNLLWSALFLTGGGTVTLLSTDLNFMKAVFSILGAILFFCFTLKYWDKKYQRIPDLVVIEEACDKLLEKLNEMEQKNG